MITDFFKQDKAKFMKPEERALKFLISRRWQYDDEKQSAKDLKMAFTSKRNSGKNVLNDAILYLNKQGWLLYCLNDLRNLDKARRIFQLYNLKNKSIKSKYE